MKNEIFQETYIKYVLWLTTKSISGNKKPDRLLDIIILIPRYPMDGGQGGQGSVQKRVTVEENKARSGTLYERHIHLLTSNMDLIVLQNITCVGKDRF